MQAVTLSRFGPPETLAFGSRPDPEVPDGWVLVELRAAALNWHDCLLRQGVYDIALPRIPGADGAGVTRTGPERDVMIMPGLHWGRGEDAPAPEFEILGDHTDGTYAELIAVPEECAVPKPSGWSHVEAAALGLAGLTAYRALFHRGRARQGETVLVLGAGGGVASVAVGLAALAGVRVLVTTSTEAKLEHAVAHGASGGVLYTEHDWPSAVRELSNGRAGVDLVIDSVGSTWPQALSCLKPGGRLVSFGATGSARTEVDVRGFYFGQHTILGTTMGSPRDFAGLLGLVERQPRWRPSIDRVFGLAESDHAHAYMESRSHTGKIALEMS